MATGEESVTVCHPVAFVLLKVPVASNVPVELHRSTISEPVIRGGPVELDGGYRSSDG